MTSLRHSASHTLAAIPPYVFWELDARRAAMRAEGKKLIDFGIGSPDQPVPELVVQAMRDAIGERALSGYPHFGGHPDFRQAIATFMQNRFGVVVNTDDEIMPVAGSKEGIAEIILAMCNPGDIVLVPEIHYPVYARATLLAGAIPVFVPFAADGRLMVETVSADDLARARILIVNYPSNPTTAVASKEQLAALVTFAEQNDVLLVSDLAYSELAFDGYFVTSVLEIEGAKEVAVEMHSCSKSFNMAGLRIGFVTGNAQAIGALDQYRANVGYGVSTLPQRAAIAAFSNYQTLVPPIVAEYKHRRDALVGALREHAWSTTLPQATMYVWLDVPTGFDDWAWVDALMRGPGVVVTPGIAFGAAGKGKFRMSLVQPAAVLVGAVPLMTEVAALKVE
ncbi:MAG: aminotransferase class I/II-fold pyridoxal phosphate-dependent enzyme [Phycisphaerae bacterium]|nr:aminotransferase class I/II-fold pyridoxal phosphate-dependent enzyme [Gemmatimonadaceae bacterium]